MLRLLFDEDIPPKRRWTCRTARLSNSVALQEKARHRNPENGWPWNALVCLAIREGEGEEEEEGFVCRWE
jgi:hypothetical protein